LPFPLVVYKKLLGIPTKLDDIAQFESDIHKGLVHILEYEGDLEEDLGVNFQVEYEVFGEKQKHNLIENGENIMVNQKNKH